MKRETSGKSDANGKRDAGDGAQVRARIVEEFERVTADIAALRDEVRPQEMEASGDNTPLSEAADAAKVIEDREVQAQVLDGLEERAAALRRALRRLDERSYGVCLRCGEPIGAERLRAVPEAEHCARCASELEVERTQADHVARTGWAPASAGRGEGEAES